MIGLLAISLFATCAGREAALAAANAALADSKPDTAEQILLPIQESAANCPIVLLMLGRTRAAQGMPTLARSLMIEYLRRQPLDAAGHVALGELFLHQRDLEGAAKSAGKALQVDANGVDGLLLQAAVFEAEKQYGEAELSYARAMDAHPRDVNAEFKAGVFFDRRHLPADAIHAFTKVLSLDGENAFAWDYLALNFEAQGNPENAEAAYIQGLKVNRAPRFDRFLEYNYGRFLMKWNRLDESEVHLTHAADLVPDTRAIYYERAKLSAVRGEYKRALADAERALRTPDPGQYIQDVQIYSLLAGVHQHLGQTDQARQFAALARSTRLKPAEGGRQ